MPNSTQIKIDYSLIIIFLLGLLYLLLPSTNNSLDSFAYASEIRDGEYLFRPHHLLYNALGYILTQFLGISNTLSFMIVVNSIFAIGCLLVLRNILLLLQTHKTTLTFILLFTGSCYGFSRFATDNEAYIIPLFFSLLASQSLIKNRSAFIISLIAAIACLFHQIHFFWWLGLLLPVLLNEKSNRPKVFFLYFLGALIVPIIYILAFYLTEHAAANILEFILYEYFNTEGVTIAFKAYTLLLTPISFIRTFFQVHGYFYPLLTTYWYLNILVLISVIFLLLSLRHIKKAFKRKNNLNNFLKNLAIGHLTIFFLQLSFAILSDGNAEFMVMLPFALFISILPRYELNQAFIKYSSIGLFIWNLSLGLIPYHFYTLYSDILMCDYIAKNANNIYIPKNQVRTYRIMNYKHPGLVYSIESPKSIDSITRLNKHVVTDIIGNTPPLSRSSIAEGSSNHLFKNLKSKKIAEMKYDLGTLNLYEVTAP